LFPPATPLKEASKKSRGYSNCGSWVRSDYAAEDPADTAKSRACYRAIRPSWLRIAA